MIWDWYASVSSANANLIDEISLSLLESKDDSLRDKKIEELINIDASLAYRMMAVRHEDWAGKVREKWTQKNLSVDCYQKLKQWGLYDFFKQTFATNDIDLSLLPPYSFKIQFEFKLKKPYISKGQDDFYIIDNPLNQDMVFRVPCVNATAWKGNLRSALRQEGCKDDEEAIVRLFGTKSDEDGDTIFHKGRLHFMSTFLGKSSLEIINPHDRRRRVGKNPILFESVPAGETGSFVLLYVPFVSGDDEIKKVAADIELVGKGISTMFTKYGFSAKASDGFGIADMTLSDGSMEINAEIDDGKQNDAIEQPEECFMKYLNSFGAVEKEYLGNGDAGLLSNSEYNNKKDQLGGGSLNEFKRFRSWYKRWGERWREHMLYASEPSKKRLSKITFRSFDEMVNAASEIRKTLKEGKSENEH